MRCDLCGEEHELLEPAFRRPEAVVRLPASEREERLKESDDLCMIRSPNPEEPTRCFVRCTLPVPLIGADDVVSWGLWAELSEENFRTVLETWSATDVSGVAPMPAQLANQIPGHAPTLGLPLELRVTGPTSRPRLSFVGATHPFARECIAGVSTHRVSEWLASMKSV